MGTPIEAYNEDGTKVWEREIDIYGRVRKENLTNFVPWLYQGQYVDTETGLAYNRFRYYDPSIGSYISQDPIKLAGENSTLYGYVYDSNCEVDIFGLSNNYPRQGGGRFGSNPNPTPSIPSVHGNSNTSTKTNYLYAKYDKDGDFLKWGKTDSPKTRYSSTELGGGKIVILGEGGSITDIKKLERELTEKMPGKANLEPWAGKKAGQQLSPEAQARASKAPHVH